MRAATLNSRITVEAPTVTRTEYGDEVKTWQTHAVLWANIRHLNGKEYALRGADAQAADTSVRIRLNRSITPQMRVLYRGQIYAIQAVLHDETGRQYTDLACQSGLNDGR